MNLNNINVNEFESTGATSLNSSFSLLSLIERIKESSRTTKTRVKALFLAGILTLTLTMTGCKKNDADMANETTIALSVNNEPLIPENALFNRLLNESESEKQKEVLSSVGNFLADYNIRFADPIEDTVTLVHRETGEEKTITIRPALAWDEVMAMTLVYNNFSKSELIEILNGADIDSYKLNNDYKMAILQLMGAHVLETRANPVNIDMILHTEEAKAFYNKYHELFLKCKETTDEERLKAVQAFYDEIYKDFPISAEQREEGIAHSDARASIQPYKFSIIPMLSAAEIMFQNLEVDYTLSQEAIDYINDIGACNIAEDILERAEYIALATANNEAYADYDAVRAAMITFLTEQKAYVIDDDHRDLSDLPAFQEIVNGFLLYPYTYTIVTSWSETTYYTVREETRTDDRDKAVEMAGEDAVREAEEKAQEELDRENEEARERAEEEADEKAEEMQEEEDRKREEAEQEVEEDDKDYQDNIDNANNNNNNGGTVNEDDLGHGTDFDDDHSNGNGDLDDSVKDITTDPSGDQTGQPLPDPNADSYSSYSADNSTYNNIPSTANESANSSKQQSAPENSTVYNEPTYEQPTYQEPSYEEPVYEYEEEYSFTSESDIDEYIESLSATTNSYEAPVKVYTL